MNSFEDYLKETADIKAPESVKRAVWRAMTTLIHAPETRRFVDVLTSRWGKTFNDVVALCGDDVHHDVRPHATIEALVIFASSVLVVATPSQAEALSTLTAVERKIRKSIERHPPTTFGPRASSKQE